MVTLPKKGKHAVEREKAVPLQGKARDRLGMTQIQVADGW